MSDRVELRNTWRWKIRSTSFVISEISSTKRSYIGVIHAF